MIFSLDPITENSELNLIQASSLSILPIVNEPIKLNLGDDFSSQFCNQISQLCGTFHLIPETHTIVLDSNDFCRLVSELDMIISNLSSDLGNN